MNGSGLKIGDWISIRQDHVDEPINGCILQKNENFIVLYDVDRLREVSIISYEKCEWEYVLFERKSLFFNKQIENFRETISSNPFGYGFLIGFVLGTLMVCTSFSIIL